MSSVLTAVVPAAALDRHRAAEDLALLAELGFERVRLGLDWAAMQPRAGAVDEDRTEAVLALAVTARSMGLELWLTLCEGTGPHWFDDEGGFADGRTAGQWWPRWVEAAAERFGDEVAGWVPIEDPLSIADALFPHDAPHHGEVVDTTLVAWRDAWRILRGGPPVATSLAVRIVRPADDTLPAAQLARRFDRLRWDVWLRALRDGTVAIPGRADRVLPDLAGACDLLAITTRSPDATTSADDVRRWGDDVISMGHRTAEDGPDVPLGIIAVTAAPDDAQRRRVVDAFADAVGALRSDLPLEAVGVAPVLDVSGRGNGLITVDREVKDSGHALVQRRSELVGQPRPR